MRILLLDIRWILNIIHTYLWHDLDNYYSNITGTHFSARKRKKTNRLININWNIN